MLSWPNLYCISVSVCLFAGGDEFKSVKLISVDVMEESGACIMYNNASAASFFFLAEVWKTADSEEVWGT